MPSIACPWCGSTKPPEDNSSDPDPKRRKLNPFICPDCSGIGSGVDWGMYLSTEFLGEAEVGGKRKKR